MCRAMEEMCKGERIECALEMLADGLPYEKVAKYSGLSQILCKVQTAIKQEQF